MTPTCLLTERLLLVCGVMIASSVKRGGIVNNADGMIRILVVNKREFCLFRAFCSTYGIVN